MVGKVAAFLDRARVIFTRVRLGAVHGDVQTKLEVILTRNNRHKLADSLDGGVADDERVHGAASDGKELNAEQFTTSFEASDVIVGKDANAKGTEETTHTVDGPDVERVVEFILLGDFDARVAPRHAEDTDDQGSPRLDKGSGRGDSGQTRDGADARADERRLAFELPLEQHPEEQSGRGGNFRVHRG